MVVYITIFQSGSSINKAQARKQFIKSSLETRPLRGIELIKAAAQASHMCERERGRIKKRAQESASGEWVKQGSESCTTRLKEIVSFYYFLEFETYMKYLQHVEEIIINKEKKNKSHD